jgi:hypothetical protein
MFRLNTFILGSFESFEPFLFDGQQKKVVAKENFELGKHPN